MRRRLAGDATTATAARDDDGYGAARRRLQLSAPAICETARSARADANMDFING
jgi:hypothetical protein